MPYKSLLLTLFFANICYADTLSPTLVELQQMAIAKSPNLAVSRAEQQVAFADTDIAISRWYPTIYTYASKTYSGSHGNYAGTLVPEESKQVSEESKQVSGKSKQETGKFGLSVTQNIYDPTINLDIQQARLNQQSSQLSIEQAYNELTNRIVALFLDILASKAELDLLDEQLVLVTEQKDLAKMSYNVGTVSITDVLEAEAKYKHISAQRNALHLQLQATQAEMQTLTGAMININAYPTGTMILPGIEKQSVEEWLVILYYQSQPLHKSLLDYQNAHLEQKKRQRQHYPTIKLVGDTNYNLKPRNSDLRPGFNDRKVDWSISLRAEIPIFGSETNGAQKVKSMAIEQQKYASMRATQEQLFIQLQNIYYQSLANKAEYEGLFSALESAETALEATQLGYKVGMRINADVLEAQTKVYEVNKERLISWYNCWRSYFELHQIAGNLKQEQLEQIDRELRSVVVREKGDVQ